MFLGAASDFLGANIRILNPSCRGHFVMVILLWLFRRGRFVMVILSWLFCCGYFVVVILP
jgi:hypothetical protein